MPGCFFVPRQVTKHIDQWGGVNCASTTMAGVAASPLRQEADSFATAIVPRTLTTSYVARLAAPKTPAVKTKMPNTNDLHPVSKPQVQPRTGHPDGIASPPQHSLAGVVRVLGAFFLSGLLSALRPLSLGLAASASGARRGGAGNRSPPPDWPWRGAPGGPNCSSAKTCPRKERKPIAGS